jgi:hypothetical protein
MESLVHWKRKRDKYYDEADEDDSEVRETRLVDSMQECKFIMRDETNAKAMRSMKIKWW